MVKKLIFLDKDGALYKKGEESSSILDDYLNNDLLEQINQIPVQMNSDYSNDIFLYFWVKLCEWKACTANFSSNFEETTLYSFPGLWKHYLIEKGVVVKSKYMDLKGELAFFLYSLMIFLVALVAPIFITYKVLTRLKSGKKEISAFSIVRSQASFNKLSKMAKEYEITLLSEDLKYVNKNITSIFSYVSFKSVLLSLFIIPKIVFKDLVAIRKDVNSVFCQQCLFDVIFYFKFRIIGKALFEFCYEAVLSTHGELTYYTGNKDDRYSIVETRIGKKYSIEVHCIPHGLEYAYKFPKGLCGDFFYCLTANSQRCLSKLYKSDKFLYNSNLCKLIYKHTSFKNFDDRKIIFFTEPRNIQVNLEIISLLIKIKGQLYIQLHPLDRRCNYDIFKGDITYLSSISNNYVNNICIARKSSILIEALYNNSTAISFSPWNMDRYFVDYMFPSLSDENILRPNLNELKGILSGY